MANKLVNKNVSNAYDLSPLQKGMLYNYFSNKNSKDYVVQNVFEIVGKIDVDIAYQALKLLFYRYDVLRTRILYEGLSNPLQVVLKNAEPELICNSLINFTPHEKTTEYERVLKSDIDHGFDLQKESLLRVRIIYYDEKCTRIVWNYHHIILDGWSISIIYRNFLDYYDLLCENHTYQEIQDWIQNEREQQTEFKDYIEWLVNRDARNDMEYWKNYLCDYEETTEIHPINRIAYTENETERLAKVKVSRDYSQKAAIMAEKYNVTLNSLVETVWGIYLQKVNFTDDVVFGKVVSGRSIDESNVRGITEIVGLIINTIPVRIKCSKDTVFSDLMINTNYQSVEENEHCTCNLAEIQGLTKQKSGLINTLYVFENFSLDTEAWVHKHLEFQAVSYREQTNYNISTIASFEDELLNLAIRYNPRVFGVEDVEKILETFNHMLCYVIDNPEKKVSEIPFVSDKEKNLILNSFNNKEKVSLDGLSVVDMIEKQVNLKGNNTAIRCGSISLSYNELNGFSNRLSKLLREVGAMPNELIPLLCKRSPEMIIGILGTLKSGAAYIPLDIEQPMERISYIIKNSGSKIILTDGSYEKEIVLEGITIINLGKIWEYGIVEENPEPTAGESNLAYCIYTSGTTGVPKGVLIERHSLTNYIYYAACNYVNKIPVIPLFSSCAFDLTVTSIFLPFVCGGEMIIYPGNAIDSILEIFNKKDFTFVKLTPSQLKIALSLENVDKLSQLETLVLGGEALTVADSSQCIIKFGNHIKIHNEYGPTEATVGCCDYIFDPDNNDTETVSIGKPIANTYIYVLKDNEICPIGVRGELCIAGEGVARGYVGTNDQGMFVENPFDHGLMYRTGDIAMWNPDGNLTFLGRIDDQIKVRGYRIEPNEIIAAICSIDSITNAVITLENDNMGNAVIFAYYVSSRNIEEEEVRQLLRNKLTPYMLPSRIIQIENLPMLSSGKVNISELPKPHNNIQNVVKAESQYERAVLFVWEEIINKQDFGIHDNFFDIGGNSLLIMKMVNLLSKTYPNVLKAGDVFANPTVYLLARHIEKYQNGQILCDKIVFPNSFYRNGMPYKQRKYSLVIESSLSKDIIFDMKYNKNETFALLLFIYCYILRECTEYDDFSVCIYKDYLYSVVKLTVEDFTDLNRLPNIILKKYEESEKFKIANIRFAEKTNGLFPIFTFNSDSNIEFKTFTDLAFEVGIDGDAISVEIELFNKEIASESAIWLLDQYQSALSEIYCVV